MTLNKLQLQLRKLQPIKPLLIIHENIITKYVMNKIKLSIKVKISMRYKNKK